MSRINRDIRFSKDKRPYKEHLGLWFWHGDKQRLGRARASGSSSRPTHVQLGVGIYMLQGDALEAFRQSVIHPRSGKALLAAVAASRPRATTRSAARHASSSRAASKPIPIARTTCSTKGSTRR